MKKITILLLFLFAMLAPMNASTATATTTATVASTSQLAEFAYEDNMSEDDGDSNDSEKMGVEVKEKRQSDKFIDGKHVTELLLAFFINFFAIMIVLRC